MVVVVVTKVEAFTAAFLEALHNGTDDDIMSWNRCLPPGPFSLSPVARITQEVVDAHV